jgi:pimeloyl-ACP methyl ester carboxylesterase
MKTISTLSSILLLSVTLSAQSIITDTRTGCQLLTENPSPSLTVSWSGDCVKKWATGKGTLVWFYDGKEVARFSGILQRGLPHGKGKYTWSNGYVQEGNYFEGAFLNLDSTYLARIEKITLRAEDKDNLYINDGNSQSLFYYALKPKGIVKGTLVLLAGATEPANYVLNNAPALTQEASDHGLTVIVPSINNNLWLGREELNFLNTTFEDATKRYQLPKDKIVMGGFSLGGLYALRYSEMSNDPAYQTSIRPVAVFAVDPPLDMTWLYWVFQNEVRRNNSETAVAESKRYILAMEKEFGGHPGDRPEAYRKFSAFSGDVKDGGNIKYLKTVPLRVYCDPDLHWQKINRKVDYDEMGARDQTAMINLLKQNGNADAEFINALGEGHNADGTRNPHSWSIVEPMRCVAWILRFMN